ncbi:MAG TPA: hypothetical protein RMH99_10555 [Sandaracinaceae bacterium LLY-WYZ-13_1]|nr:hypothetical protein [Sandaracinaceae bacterium LLY-WYZ-13_1]
MSRRLGRAVGALALLVVLVTGCVADRSGNPHYDPDCSSETCDGTCYRGFCLTGGMDGGADECPPEAVCYDGPAGTEGVGVCRAGCLVEVPGRDEPVCFEQATPGDELCNQVDDDCDESVDEGFDLSTDAQCGACGVSCDASETCCAAQGGGFECANFASDPDHCGDCETRCPTGRSCCGDDGCVDTETDPMNCGGCGEECPPGWLCCDGGCADPRSSRDHCDGCGNPCTGSDVCCPSESDGVVGCRAESGCVMCAEACDGPDERCCAGTCVDDIRADPRNCGGCGIACGTDERCCAGSCVPLDEACASCGDACGATERCCDDACVPDESEMHCGGCGIACDPGETCCAGECTDVSDDDANCGACGEVCAGEHCSNSHCCALGESWCDGGCVDTAGDSTHCGRCGNTCTGAETCNRGALGGQPWDCRDLGIL